MRFTIVNGELLDQLKDDKLHIILTGQLPPQPVTSQLRKILISSLLNGSTVQLGDWGSFYLTLGCEGVDNPEDAVPDKVRKINIRFLPGRELKDALVKAEFRDAASLSK